MKEFEGYGLFDDIEDEKLRSSNRAKTMSIIWGQHSEDDELSEEGLFLMKGYFGAIPNEERASAYLDFVDIMAHDGYEPVIVAQKAQE